MTIYVVTNYGGGQNYTPSVFKDKAEARKWFEELAADNIFEIYEDEFTEIGYDRTMTKEILSHFTDEPEDDVSVYENTICVGSPDEGGNVIQFFELEI